MKRRRDSGEFAAEGSNPGCLSLSFWQDLLLVCSSFAKPGLCTGCEVAVMKHLRFGRAGVSVQSLCSAVEAPALSTERKPKMGLETLG